MEWMNFNDVDLGKTRNIRVDTRDFKALATEGTCCKMKSELLEEGLSEGNFIDGEDLMGWIHGLMRRNMEKPLWIGRNDIKYIGLEKCSDDHWLVMDRDRHPIEWKEI